MTVLPKDTSVDDVMKIMKAWNTALNVDCVFCHVGQVGKPLSTFDFASDNKKRKEASRIMLRAVMDTNEKFKTIGEDEPPQVSVRDVPQTLAPCRGHAAGGATQGTLSPPAGSHRHGGCRHATS